MLILSKVRSGELGTYDLILAMTLDSPVKPNLDTHEAKENDQT